LASHKKTRTGSRGPFSTLTLQGPKVLLCLSQKAGLLSWGSSKIALPPINTACPLPVCLRKGSPSVQIAKSEHVPLLSFLPTSAVYSTRYRVGLLHPTTGHGVRRVSSLSRSEDPRSTFPNGAVPYEAFPSSTAERRHCYHQPKLVPTFTESHSFSSLLAVSSQLLTVLPPIELGPLPVTRPQGFELPKNPLQEPRCCHRGSARCSLGLFSNLTAHHTTATGSGGRLRSEERGLLPANDPKVIDSAWRMTEHPHTSRRLRGSPGGEQVFPKEDQGWSTRTVMLLLSPKGLLPRQTVRLLSEENRAYRLNLPAAPRKEPPSHLGLSNALLSARRPCVALRFVRPLRRGTSFRSARSQLHFRRIAPVCGVVCTTDCYPEGRLSLIATPKGCALVQSDFG
jgi:hypothetical protein